MPEQLTGETLVIFEGLEAIIKHSIDHEVAATREHWREIFNVWQNWEVEKHDRKVIFIGCDITKGVVPLLEIDRNWRDITGWCYQDLTQVCTRVDVIWNGLAQTIKLEGDEEL